MTDTPHERAEWLAKHGAPPDWVIVTTGEVADAKREFEALLALLTDTERALTNWSQWITLGGTFAEISALKDKVSAALAPPATPR